MDNPRAAEDQCEEGLEPEFGSGTEFALDGSGDHAPGSVPVCQVQKMAADTKMIGTFDINLYRYNR